MEYNMREVRYLRETDPECVRVDLMTGLQRGFIDRIGSEGIGAALKWLLPRKNLGEHTYPADLNFSWERGDAPYLFELSENEDFSESYKEEVGEPEITLTNFKIGQRYFWRVDRGEAHEFVTDGDRFRFIRIDGIINVRDVGGINIKQGMVYRGSELYHEFKITEAGKRELTHRLGIKTELNLRQEYSFPGGGSCLGDGVECVTLKYRPYDEIFEEQHLEGIVKIMELLADEEKYPVYFHCLGGADRTGMIALYLRAILGESDEDMLTDYELTSLSSYMGGAKEGVSTFFRSREEAYFERLITGLLAYEGKTFGERLVSFLRFAGVKEETFESIRRILKKD